MLDILREFASEIIAVCAIFLTITQAKRQREHHRISVQPHLSVFTNQDFDGANGVLQAVLENNGLGPAFIKEYQLYLDKEPKEDVDGVLSSLVQGFGVIRSGHSTLRPGSAYPAGEKKALISLNFLTNEQSVVDGIRKSLNRLDVKITYEDGYKNTFKLDTRELSFEEKFS